MRDLRKEVALTGFNYAVRIATYRRQAAARGWLLLLLIPLSGCLGFVIKAPSGPLSDAAGNLMVAISGLALLVAPPLRPLGAPAETAGIENATSALIGRALAAGVAAAALVVWALSSRFDRPAILVLALIGGSLLGRWTTVLALKTLGAQRYPIAQRLGWSIFGFMLLLGTILVLISPARAAALLQNAKVTGEMGRSLLQIGLAPWLAALWSYVALAPVAAWLTYQTLWILAWPVAIAGLAATGIL